VCFARSPASFLLPFLALTVWSLLVPVPAIVLYDRLRQSAPITDPAHFHLGQFELSLPRNRLFSFCLRSVAEQRSHTITAVNLPGSIVEILISLPTSWPGLWHPKDFSANSWRSLVLPFFCLPAWWLVGCSIDGFLKRRTVHWGLLLTGSILSILFIVIFFGFLFGLSRSERGDEDWVLWGLGFWAVTFGVMPLVWLRQRTAARSEHLQAGPRAGAGR
jgi:hypothetical protein